MRRQAISPLSKGDNDAPQALLSPAGATGCEPALPREEHIHGSRY